MLARLVLGILPLLLATGAQGRRWKDMEPLLSTPLDSVNNESKLVNLLMADRPPASSSLKLNDLDFTDTDDNQNVRVEPVYGPILKRSKRSGGIPLSDTVTCDKEVIDILSKTTEEACASTRDIDKYISQVKSVRPVEVSTFSEESYKGIIKDYNVDLANAHRNYNEWRQGNGIFNALKETFHAAKDFSLTFEAEFKKNQRTVAAVATRNIQEIMDMEESIGRLQREINETQEVIRLAAQASTNKFLADVLRQKQHELEQLLNNEERVKTEKELNELIAFLEMVAHSVGSIQFKTFATAIRVEEFQEKIVRDSSIFLRHRENAQSGLQRLQAQREANSNERIRLQNEKKALEAGIRENSDEISRIKTQLRHAEQELSDINDTISRKQKAARDKQIAGGVLMIIPVFGWIAGGTLLGVSVEEEKRLANTKRNIINQHRRMLDSQQAQITSLHLSIQNAERRIRTYNAEFNILGDELNYFSKLDQDLDKIKRDISSILPAVNKALLSTAKVKEVFDGLRQNLNDIIEAAEEAKVNGINKDLAYFIYNSISTLECEWDQANVRIITLGECV